MLNQDNCHPFEVFPGLVMAHNGIIDHVDATPEISDTRIFIMQVLSWLPDDFLFNEGIRQLISGFIGHSRLVFLDRYGMFHIINEHLGHWDDEHSNWFSNDSYWSGAYTSFASFHSKSRSSHGYKNKKYPAGHWNPDDWSACDSCGNLVETDDLTYNNLWQTIMCKDCLEFFYEEEASQK